MNTKKAIVAKLCGRSIVRGNTPMAAIAIEPRARLATANFPGRLDGRLLPRPTAKIRLSRPVKISPQLNSAVAEPATPRTLMWFSVQLNQGEPEMATNRAVRPTSGEAMPQSPAILLSTAPLPNLTFNHLAESFKWEVSFNRLIIAPRFDVSKILSEALSKRICHQQPGSIPSRWHTSTRSGPL